MIKQIAGKRSAYVLPKKILDIMHFTGAKRHACKKIQNSGHTTLIVCLDGHCNSQNLIFVDLLTKIY